MNTKAATTPSRITRFSLLAAAAWLLAFGPGCDSGVKVASPGEPVKGGPIEVTVNGYDVRKLEVVEGKRIHEYKKPVLAIETTFKNVGKEKFRYTPTHSSQQMTESTTPLLYSDPGKNATLPPENKSPINGVVLKEGQLEEQIEKSTSIAPGSSITDVMLFEVPAEKQAKLIYSVPPSMHGGEAPILFRLNYTYKKPKGPTWNGIGDAVDVKGVAFKVTKVSTEYIELANTSQGKAFSSSPLLKIAYTIKNKSKKAVTYSPGHQAVTGRRGASVRAGGETIGRVKFSSNAEVAGQLSESTTIKPGKKVEDFTVFERPGKGVKKLKFEYPASRFGRTGLVRFELPYKYEKPEKPDALKKDEEEEEEE